MVADALKLQPEQQTALQDVVRRRTGIVLQPYQLDKLDGIVADACARFGYPQAQAYLQVLNDAGGVSPELEYLVSHITVGESYFFRDDEQLRFLREAWLPEIIDRKYHRGERVLRIWSAGCSAGQEIYTLAMLLAEDLPEPETWGLHLLGTDINTDALNLAIRGQYSAWSLRATSPELQGKYFTRLGDQFQVTAGLRELVKFSYLNLLEDAFPTMLSGTSAMDLILCRNVFIYFDPAVVGGIMEKFHASLLPGGYLLLGASDLAAEPRPGLELHHWGNTFCFRRTDGMLPVPESTVGERPVRPAPLPSMAEPEPPPPPPPPRHADGHRSRSPYQDIIVLLRAERWEDVVRKVDEHAEAHGFDAELAQHKAKALANLGQLDEAAKQSGASIDMAPMDKHTYLINALIMQELNNTEKAVEALRRAIYLDANFVEAHFQLGLLQLRMGDRKAGMRSLSNALELAEKLDPDRQVHNAPGMVFGRLAEILRKELHVYKGDA